MHVNRNYIVGFLCVFLASQWPAIRPLLKYTPAQFPLAIVIPVYIILVVLGYMAIAYYASQERFKNLAINRYFSLVCLLVLLPISYMFYHHELSLQALGKGADSSNALILAASNLWHGIYPYSSVTYLNNAISPGPGWAALAIPFALIPHAYPLMIPVLSMLACWAVYSVQRDWRAVAVFICLLFMSLSTWEFFAEGSDIIAIGLVFFILTVLIYKFQTDHAVLVILAIILGMAATSRVVFIYIIPCLSYFLFRQDKTRGLMFCVIGILTAIGIHWYFHEWGTRIGSYYAPLHVLNKVPVKSPLASLSYVIPCALVAIRILLGHYKTLTEWCYVFWLALIAPLFVLSIYDLWSFQWNLALFQGPEYVLITAPLAVGWWTFVLTNSSSKG